MSYQKSGKASLLLAQPKWYDRDERDRFQFRGGLRRFLRRRSIKMKTKLTILIACLSTILTVSVGPTIDHANAEVESIVWPTLTLTQIASGLSDPLGITHAGDGSGRIFIVEQPGRIKIQYSGAVLSTPFLDISANVLFNGERGLLGLAFPPEYDEKGYFYVDYTRKSDGATVIARYYRTIANPDIADPSSEQIILTIAQPFSNHNGGQIAFGPDGYLYIGMGDGGSGGDPQGNAQNPETLLGKILRIDVEATGSPLFSDPPPTLSPYVYYLPLIAKGIEIPYLIPDSNPYVEDPSGLDEIWAIGLRNPWRFSFDRSNGDLYIADVGQGSREEVNFQSASSSGGENYGWNIMEGTSCYNAASCDMTGLTLPVADYSHTLGCSVSGGYVYRGADISSLQGIYLYGDYCSGRIWGLVFESGSWTTTEFMDTTLRISSFGEDETGNVYVADIDGGVIYRIDEN